MTGRKDKKDSAASHRKKAADHNNGGKRKQEHKDKGAHRGRIGKGRVATSHSDDFEPRGIQPTILSKPDRAFSIDFPSLQQATATSGASAIVAAPQRKTAHSQEDSTTSDVDSGAKVVQQRGSRLFDEDKARPSTPSKKDEIAAQEQTGGPNKGFTQPERYCKFLDEHQRISENLAQFLTDNSDFLVVGVLGPQGAGKSTILNELACKEGLFRVQSFEKQMAGEHSTTGIHAWISPQRVIYLDSQPLNSASVMEKMMVFEKKGSILSSSVPEFGTMEDTVEIQSLQLAGFFMNICHVVIVVQDWFLDLDMLRMIHTAELLKPSSTTHFNMDEESSGVVEYFPDVIFVQNKADLDSFTGANVGEMQEILARTFSKSRLKYASNRSIVNDTNCLRHLVPRSSSYPEVNLFLLPEKPMENEYDERFSAELQFDDILAALRRAILSTPRSPLTSSVKCTEKAWFQFAQRSWDNIKKASQYVEYNKLV